MQVIGKSKNPLLGKNNGTGAGSFCDFRINIKVFVVVDNKITGEKKNWAIYVLLHYGIIMDIKPSLWRKNGVLN